MILEHVSPDVLERARRVSFVLLDCDGVMTDGKIYASSDGGDGRTFHTHDGLGIRMGQHVGLGFGILSGRESAVVSARARELDIDELHQRVVRKGDCFDEILARRGLSEEAVCFVGDDLIDLPVLRRAGLAIAPPDARPEVLEQVHWVTPRPGGHGAVRDVVDLLLRAAGRWDEVTERYFR